MNSNDMLGFDTSPYLNMVGRLEAVDTTYLAPRRVQSYQRMIGEGVARLFQKNLPAAGDQYPGSRMRGAGALTCLYHYRHPYRADLLASLPCSHRRRRPRHDQARESARCSPRGRIANCHKGNQLHHRCHAFLPICIRRYDRSNRLYNQNRRKFDPVKMLSRGIRARTELQSLL
jgi:hypothetical protein